MGVKGYTIQNGRYRACIKVNGQVIQLGRYDTASEAREVFLDAVKRHPRSRGENALNKIKPKPRKPRNPVAPKLKAAVPKRSQSKPAKVKPRKPEPIRNSRRIDPNGAAKWRAVWERMI